MKNNMYNSASKNGFLISGRNLAMSCLLGICLGSCQGSGSEDLGSTTDSLRTYRDSATVGKTDGTGANSPANPITSKAKIDDDQANFLKQAAAGGMMEVEAGKVAAANASGNPVKEFAKMMITDHTKAASELNVIAMELGVLIPSSLSKEHQDHLKMLSAKKGSEFDKAYMKMMIDDHAKTVELFKSFTSARNPKVADFATKHLPIIEAHYKQALNLGN